MFLSIFPIIIMQKMILNNNKLSNYTTLIHIYADNFFKYYFL